MLTNKISLEELISKAKNLAPGNSSYLKSYPEFTTYFQGIDKIERHHLVIASHFTYGWMPTILFLDLKEEVDVLQLLNDAKAGKILNGAALGKLKKAVNNSMVGTSKLLHFIRPDLYAIWDSRIFKAYYSGKKTTYGIDNPDNYLKYLQDLTQLSAQARIVELQEQVMALSGYPVTALRAIEYVLFEYIKEPVKLPDIFTERPFQWGLRGDRYLWDALESAFRSRDAPSSLLEFQQQFKALYQELTGSELEKAETIYLDQYSHGGMSSGGICGNFWLNTALPLLSERYKHGHDSSLL